MEVQAARSNGARRFRVGLKVSTALTDVATVTRATQAWGVDQGGNVAAVAAGQPVVTTAGLAVYEARTNSLRNPTFLGAAAGSPGTDPTNYTITKSLNGVSCAISGVGVEGGEEYIELTYSGTASADTYMQNFMEASGIIAASQGQVWTEHLVARLVSGTAPDFVQLTLVEQTSAPAYLSEQGFSRTISSAKKTLRASATVAGATAAYVRPRFDVHFGNGVTANCVIRIYSPNLKLGADIGDAPIRQTNNAAATRNADVIVEPVNIPVGQDFTIVGKLLSAPATGAAAGYPWVMSLVDVAPSYRNRLSMFFGSGGLALAATSAAGEISTGGAAGSFTALAPIGFAISISGGVARVSYNGGAPSSVTIPGGAFDAAFTKLFLGCSEAGTQQLNSALRQLSISMRAFSAAELQAASDITLTHDIDFVSQVYQYVGAPYVTPTDLPGTSFSRASGGYGDTTAGLLVWFGAGALRVTDAGLKVEPAATNIDPNSLTIGGTGWTTNGSPTVTQNFAVAPDGSVTATRVQSTTTNSGPWRGGINLTAGSAYTRSIWLKDNGGSVKTVTLGIGQAVFGGSGGDRNVTFNVSTGVLTGVNAVYTSTAVRQAADGWWRVSLTFTPTSTATANFAIYGTAAGADFLVWNHQPEPGVVATSDITTAGAATTRNADVLASANDSNPTAYTVVAEFSIPATGPTAGLVWQWDDGTANNKSLLYYNRSTGHLYCQVYTGGVVQANLDLGAVTAGNSYKVALRVAANDFAASLGGAAVVTDASGTVPTTNAFRVGADIPGAGGEWSGYIRRVRRYSVGKTNAELQALAA